MIIASCHEIQVDMYFNSSYLFLRLLSHREYRLCYLFNFVDDTVVLREFHHRK